MQFPAKQRWRGLHEGPMPQLQDPSALQLSAEVKLHSVHTPPAVPQ